MAQNTPLSRMTVKKFCSRLEAARILSCTVQAIHKYEARGLLVAVPIADAHGYRRPVGPGRTPTSVLRFEDVQRLKDAENIRRFGAGELAAKAWEMFRDGKSVVDVVIHLKIAPERAREMHEQYRLSVGGLTVPATVLSDMKSLGFAVDASTFVPTIERLLRAVREARRQSP